MNSNFLRRCRDLCRESTFFRINLTVSLVGFLYWLLG